MRLSDQVLCAVEDASNGKLDSALLHSCIAIDTQLPIRDWWGKEDDFRSIAAKYNQTRIKVEGLERLGTA